ncbi:multidrug transporter [Pseudomonas capsici]|uniref:Multidrug transporter n=1 Tax=Pseudomonas capsici TaxID=2810614 RepID=A0ABT3BVF3_9PSED|nr:MULTISPECIES: multidrug transporter [Pseudomonas]MBN6713688.1 multidrug transporter [Pseudomonas capsici]MBN6719089.1 multidrug transporter [Pseudomonas capsici]MBN6723878.1 multidrug transporter [Pseudomonas capsici]MBX8475065.1 multidrug transporter [Pseudomonas cichorii]MBX8607986.1 multidrug transporter [Pseudomonas cichorii]
MRPFRILAATLTLLVGLQALPAMATELPPGSGDPVYSIQTPPAFAMIGDLIIARPLLIAATIVGTGLFVIAAPFAAAGGNLGATGKALVVDPGKAAFVRCLGCTGDGYGKQE